MCLSGTQRQRLDNMHRACWPVLQPLRAWVRLQKPPPQEQELHLPARCTQHALCNCRSSQVNAQPYLQAELMSVPSIPGRQMPCKCVHVRMCMCMCSMHACVHKRVCTHHRVHCQEGMQWHVRAQAQTGRGGRAAALILLFRSTSLTVRTLHCKASRFQSDNTLTMTGNPRVTVHVFHSVSLWFWRTW